MESISTQNLTRTIHNITYSNPSKLDTSDLAKAAVLLSISCLIIFGNILTLLVFQKMKSFKATTKMFIYSLTIADLLVGSVLIPLRLNEVLKAPWTYNLSWCKLSISSNILNLSASMLNLLAMNAERMIYITKPMQYTYYITKVRITIFLICMWTSFAFISFAPIFSGLVMQNTAIKKEQDHLCKYTTILKRGYLHMFSAAYPVSFLLFPCFYVKIYQTVHKQQRSIRSTRSLPANRVKIQERKSIFLLLALTVVFYVCWTPNGTAIYLSIYSPDLVTQDFIFAIISIVYSNSFLNSIVYYFFNAEFRKHYNKYLHKLCIRNVQSEIV